MRTRETSSFDICSEVIVRDEKETIQLCSLDPCIEASHVLLDDVREATVREIGAGRW